MIKNSLNKLKNQVKLFPNKYLFSSNNNQQESLIYEKQENGIIFLKLNEHESRNALSLKMINQLKEYTEMINNDQQARLVILKSAHKNMFCAGANLKERKGMDDFQTELLVEKLRNTFFAFRNISIPTIGCIDGFALGGGLELGMSCDIRICSSTAVLGLVETALAIIPGAGGTQNLLRLIGSAKAKELIFTSQKLNAQQSLSLGIVNYVENDYDAVDKKALELAEMILKNGPIAIKMAKQAINQGMDVDIKTGMNIERMCYAQVVQTQDRREGLLAFQEKRKPVYQGK